MIVSGKRDARRIKKKVEGGSSERGRGATMNEGARVSRFPAER